MRHALRLCLVALATAVLSASAAAQFPGATPVPTSLAKSGSAPAGGPSFPAGGASGPASGGAAGAAPGLAPAGLQAGTFAGAAGPKVPDLVVTMAPGNPFPASFTVKNAGNADAGVSVLRVTATLLPLDRIPSEPCPPIFASICDARAQAAAAWYTPERLQTMCGDPFADVLEAIPALKAGESKTVARDTSRFANLAVRLKGALGPQPGTHIVQGVTTLVCAFDVVAQADASNQVREIREDNNTSTRRVFREIRLE